MREQLRAMATGTDSSRTLVDLSLATPDATDACAALQRAIEADRNAPAGGRILPPSGWLHPL